MSWQAYEIRFQLRAPLHSGAGKLGNLQLTRPYVTGRNLWGALTARLTRDMDARGKPAATEYRDIGERVHEELAVTYFYPFTYVEPGKIAPLWPWDTGFRYRHLSTSAGTALNYSRTSAEEASLHEVECLLPYTRGTRQPVYLRGYIFERDDTQLRWRDALQRFQVGGERGYGWGRLELVAAPKLATEIFDGYQLRLNGKRPLIELPAKKPLLAHALAADFEESKALVEANAKFKGTVAPLVGRETTAADSFGQSLSQARICYAPGTRLAAALTAQIGRFGIWEAPDAPAA